MKLREGDVLKYGKRCEVKKSDFVPVIRTRKRRRANELKRGRKRRKKERSKRKTMTFRC